MKTRFEVSLNITNPHANLSAEEVLRYLMAGLKDCPPIFDAVEVKEIKE